MASSEPLTSTGYIKHHLQNLTFGQLPDGSWGLAHGAAEAKAMGFWAIHLDTMFWSVTLGVLFLWSFRKAAKRATVGVPSGFVNFVEWVVEFVDDNVRGSFSHKSDLVAPLALTLFVWVLLMNTMDLVPVDWIPELAKLMGIEYMKVVPTTDPNATFGMAIGVFVLTVFAFMLDHRLRLPIRMQMLSVCVWIYVSRSKMLASRKFFESISAAAFQRTT